MNLKAKLALLLMVIVAATAALSGWATRWSGNPLFTWLLILALSLVPRMMAGGDRFSVGTAEVAVTQPRLPCYKLGVRFGSDDMVKRFLASGRTGFYVAVVREGEVGAGDEMKVIAREANAVAV